MKVWVLSSSAVISNFKSEKAHVIMDVGLFAFELKQPGYSAIRPFSARVSPIRQYTSSESSAQPVTYQ